MKRILLITTLLLLPFASVLQAAPSGYYEECILKNLDKAKTDAAVTALKEVCASEAQRIKANCENKKAEELTSEELCGCLGMAFDANTRKCTSLGSKIPNEKQK